jgi:hypothetical protein
VEFTDFKCDVCGSQRSGAAGWLVAAVPPVSDEPTKQGIGFATIETSEADEEAYQSGFTIEHICSHACAMKRFSQWLGTL